MIIDCHGHYTTAPAALQEFRDAQLASSCAAARTRRCRSRPGRDQRRRDPGDDRGQPAAAGARARHRPDDLLAPGVRAWGTTSPTRPPRSGLGAGLQRPHLPGDHAVPRQLRRASCQLPQVAGGPLDDCVAELERCVTELGFVGCNLNPDPSGGVWTSPPLTDEYWFPLYEKMTELDVPAMIHVSTSCNPAVHTARRALPERRHDRVHAAASRATCSAGSRRCGSSSRTAAARCPTTGAGSRASPTREKLPADRAST